VLDNETSYTVVHSRFGAFMSPCGPLRRVSNIMSLLSLVVEAVFRIQRTRLSIRHWLPMSTKMAISATDSLGGH